MHWFKVLRIACLFCTLVFASALRAQSVQYFEKDKLWLLSTDHNSYVLAAGPHGELRHLYWGRRLQREGDLTPPAAVPDISSFDPSQMLINEEYPGWGGPFYEEPPLRSRARMAIATWCCMQERARDLLARPAILAVARMGKTFRPVENNTGDSATDEFVYRNRSTWYLAVFNCQQEPVTKHIDLARAGLSPRTRYRITDLWNGTSFIALDKFSVNLEGAQAALFSLETP